MITNTVKLPNRFNRGFISTIEPISNRKDVSDSYIRGYGCSFNLNGFQDYDKYKIVEQFCDRIIERVVYTDKGLLDGRCWPASNTPIFPVWCKEYTIPISPTAAVYRYLNGSSFMASAGSCGTPITQTIFTPVWNKVSDAKLYGLLDCGREIDDYTDSIELSKIVVPGDDSANISMCCNISSAVEDYVSSTNSGSNSDNDADADPPITEETLYDWLSYNGGFIPMYSHDFGHWLYGSSHITAKDLLPEVTHEYLRHPIRCKPDQFEINTDEYNYEHDCEVRSLLTDLEHSGFTDIEMSVTVDGSGAITGTENMTNIHLGVSPRYSEPDFVYGRKTLFDSFVRYVGKKINLNPNITRVALLKTWNEEVFVTMYDNKSSVIEQQLFDLIALSIGSLSFTDING